SGTRREPCSRAKPEASDELAPLIPLLPTATSRTEIAATSNRAASRRAATLADAANTAGRVARPDDDDPAKGPLGVDGNRSGRPPGAPVRCDLVRGECPAGREDRFPSGRDSLDESRLLCARAWRPVWTCLAGIRDH